MNEQIKIKVSKSIDLHIFMHGWCSPEKDIEKTPNTNFYGLIIGWFTFDLHVGKHKSR